MDTEAFRRQGDARAEYYELFPMGSVDLGAPTARVRRMDVLGIDVQVLFSYFWLIAAAAAADDTVAAEVRNRFLSTRRADTFRGCAVNDSGHSSVD